MIHNPSIYLIGYISNTAWKECQAWRTRCKEARQGYRFIDPMDGEDPSMVKDQGLKSTVCGKALVLRDLQSVRDAKIILGNTDTFGKARPLTGTVFEMAWTYSMQKPLLLWTPNAGKKDDYYTEHPFVQEAATFMSPDFEEVMHYLDFIVKGL